MIDSDDLLVAFLRARLDDKERDALAASPGPWKPNAEQDEVLAADDITVADGFALSSGQLRATVRHIARHDPVLALAEVAAYRRILDSFERNPTPETFWVIEHLAYPYASHPDYHTEWAPDL